MTAPRRTRLGGRSRSRVGGQGPGCRCRTCLPPARTASSAGGRGSRPGGRKGEGAEGRWDQTEKRGLGSDREMGAGIRQRNWGWDLGSDRETGAGIRQRKGAGGWDQTEKLGLGSDRETGAGIRQRNGGWDQTEKGGWDQTEKRGLGSDRETGAGIRQRNGGWDQTEKRGLGSDRETGAGIRQRNQGVRSEREIKG